MLQTGIDLAKSGELGEGVRPELARRGLLAPSTPAAERSLVPAR